MIKRILIALLIVIGVYFLPVAAEYTNLGLLRENTYYHVAVIVAMLAFVRGWTCIAICVVEVALIYCNFHLACNWDLRNQIFIARYYSTLQEVSFYIELTIIAATIINGLREIGADIERYRHWFSDVAGLHGSDERNT